MLRWDVQEADDRPSVQIDNSFTSADESALGVADDVNSSRMILIYGADDSSERFHLFPHRSQTVDPVQGIDNSHVRRWVQLFFETENKMFQQISSNGEWERNKPRVCDRP